MGVLLTQIIINEPLTLEDLRGKRLAPDTNGELYRLLRFLTTSGKEFLPSNGTFRPNCSRSDRYNGLLAHYGISRERLVDLAILVGTDFCAGVKGAVRKKR